MVPDTKWDLKDPQMLYTLAIAKDPSLRSVRDLRGRHVPMLQRLKQGALALLREKHGVPPSALRVYMHYLPSFWWVHIHFAALTCTAAGAATAVGKAVLLDDIVDNLIRDPDHYANASLTVVVGERDPLYLRLRQAGAIDDGGAGVSEQPAGSEVVAKKSRISDA
jgi:m7GpppX diphosphatase